MQRIRLEGEGQTRGHVAEFLAFATTALSPAKVHALKSAQAWTGRSKPRRMVSFSVSRRSCP